jgi:hypothetical protein
MSISEVWEAVVLHAIGAVMGHGMGPLVKDELYGYTTST